MINGLNFKLCAVASILLLVVSAIHAGEWSGDVSRQASETDTLCVELDKKNSPHLQKICLKKINVKWTLKTSEQSALVRSSIQWQLQPTLWLRTKGERPLSSFSKSIQTAYQAIVPSDMTLAAFFYPEVNSAPSNTGSGFDNLGIALEIGAGNLKKSGENFSFSTPSSPGWDTLLIDAPSHIPCIISKQEKSADYIPAEISKELARDGMSLSGLTLCQLSFADLKQLNTAMQTTKVKSESQTADKGISLDDLLAGIDPVASVGSSAKKDTGGASLDDLLADIDPVTSTDSLASEETAKAGASLDDLLEGIEERIAQKRQQEATAEAQRVVDVTASNCRQFFSALEEQDRAVIKASNNFCDSKVENVNEAIDNQIRLMSQSTTHVRYSGSHKAHEILDEFESCINEDGPKLDKILDKSKDIRLTIIKEQCINSDGVDAFVDAREQFTKAIDNKIYRLFDIYDDAERMIGDLDAREAQNNFQLDNEAYNYAASIRDNLLTYGDWQSQEVNDIAERSSALMQQYYNGNSDSVSRGAASFSYPETSRTSNSSIQPPDDTCYFADGRRASGSELPACVALKNNSEKRNIGNCGNNDGSGGGCDKTQ